MNGAYQGDIEWMNRAIALAQQAAANDEVPVGAVLIHNNQVIGEGYNQPITSNDPTSHAEINALRTAASQLENYRLPGSTLYVTLEPCAMCLGAMIQARVERLVFGAWDPRAGAVRSVFQIADEPRINHRIACRGGLLEDDCALILQEFFRERRRKPSRELSIQQERDVRGEFAHCAGEHCHN